MSYKKQFYNEGLGITFYQKPMKFIKKKIKNEKLYKLASLTIKICYTLFAIVFAIIIFMANWPL